MNSSEVETYIKLAELFFLDQETKTQDLQAVASSINSLSWGKEKTKQILVQQLAPIYAANIGYGIYPVIGIWDGFNKEELINHLNQNKKKKVLFKQLKESFYFWMIKRLGWEEFAEYIEGT